MKGPAGTLCALLVFAAVISGRLHVATARGLRTRRQDVAISSSRPSGGPSPAGAAQLLEKLSSVVHRQGHTEALGQAETKTLLRQQELLEAIGAQESLLVVKEQELSMQAKDTNDQIVAFAEMRRHSSTGSSVKLGTFLVAEPNFKQLYSWEHFAGIGVYLFQVILIACIYQRFLKHSYAKLPHDEIKMGRFQYNLLDTTHIGRDVQICCMSLFCGGIRWADTVSSAGIGVMPFWSALIIFSLLSAFMGASLCATALAFLAMVVYCRQKIRQAYGMPSWTVSTLCFDTVIWTCCSCCAIAQEARQVEVVEALPDLESDMFKTTAAGPDGPIDQTHSDVDMTSRTVM